MSQNITGQNLLVIILLPFVLADEVNFIIGDRVCAGNKPGIIAYLGDVKFAAGDFAGVVLGKRSGLVH